MVYMPLLNATLLHTTFNSHVPLDT